MIPSKNKKRIFKWSLSIKGNNKTSLLEEWRGLAGNHILEVQLLVISCEDIHLRANLYLENQIASTDLSPSATEESQEFVLPNKQPKKLNVISIFSLQAQNTSIWNGKNIVPREKIPWQLFHSGPIVLSPCTPLLAFHYHSQKQFQPSTDLQPQCAPNHTAHMRMTWFNLFSSRGNPKWDGCKSCRKKWHNAKVHEWEEHKSSERINAESVNILEIYSLHNIGSSLEVFQFSRSPCCINIFNWS